MKAMSPNGILRDKLFSDKTNKRITKSQFSQIG